MRPIRNVSLVAQSIPSLGHDVAPGDTVDVDDGVADELTARDEWAQVGAPKVQSKAEILAAVGDDPVAAQVALEAEVARGDKARSTVVAALVALTEVPSADADPTENQE